MCSGPGTRPLGCLHAQPCSCRPGIHRCSQPWSRGPPARPLRRLRAQQFVRGKAARCDDPRGPVLLAGALFLVFTTCYVILMVWIF